MKKFVSILLVIMVLLTAGACSKQESNLQKGDSSSKEAKSSKEESFEISYSTWASEGEAAYEGMKKFKEIVEEESNNRITVNLFPSSQLGSTEEQHEQLAMNTIQMMSSGNPGIKELEYLALPYLMGSMDGWMEVLSSDIGEKFNKILLEKQGVVNIGFLPRNPRIVSCNKAIHTPEDFKGVKLRTPERDYYVETFKALGANPTPLAFGEVYSALQTGVVDGQENPIETIYSAGFHEIQDYIIITNHIRKPAFVSANNEFILGLSEKDRELVMRACDEGRKYAEELAAEQVVEFRKKIEEAGVKIIEPEIEPFVQATEKVREKLGMEVWGKETYNRIKEIGQKY
ncbi:MAG: TRAP transporter substrate-binding protein [Maledivibacter sp.]|nr:TRAP transporter substrate-binding protein [Maledivibacter sp.]